jgi:hypothetical protein
MQKHLGQKDKNAPVLIFLPPTFLLSAARRYSAAVRWLGEGDGSSEKSRTEEDSWFAPTYLVGKGANP